MKYFTSIVIGAVAVLVVVGLWVAGSPKTERMRRFDQMRVEGLQSIQNQVVEFWRAKGRLPNALSEVTDGLGGYYIPVDPEESKEYEYEKFGDLGFRLCADFATSTTLPYGMNDKRGYYPEPVYPGLAKGSDAWAHTAGRACFDRTIDPAYFAPQKID